jgi:hypothetical protein
MTIGNDTAFPSDPRNSDWHPTPGMTYRQWLIGQALHGTIILHNGSAGYAARDAIEAADAILKRLATERTT